MVWVSVLGINHTGAGPDDGKKGRDYKNKNTGWC